MPNLFDVLLCFRCHQIFLISDIEKAFLQVSIAPEHHDFLRFLWVSDVNEAHPKIVIKRMTRAMFGVTSSSFLLGGTLQHHISKYEEEDPEIVKKLLESFYVDDFNSGEENVDQAFELYLKFKKILSDGGFTLRTWSSNSKELLELISKIEPDATNITNREESKEESSYAEIMLGHPNQDTQAEGEQKVLGLLWNTKEGTLVFQFGHLIKLAKELPATKLSVIKVIASVYDPIGFISPFVIPMKILFQDLCSEKEDWDSPLSAEYLKRWQNWIAELSKVQEVQVPRSCFVNHVTSIELNSFSDASIKAFAAAVYLRLESEDNVSTTLVASKTRVAPLKQQSLPRLELLGALISSRLASAVERAVSSCIIINSVYCWTDSITALFWIKGVDKEFKQFVENRVAEIRKKTDTSSWNHITGKDNQSDLPTRGLQLGELPESDHWWHGPSWLSLPNDCWPQPLSKLEPTTEAIAEMKKECKKLQSEVNLFLTFFLHFSYCFSCWFKLR